MSTRSRRLHWIEITIGCALATQLQWVFGNIYEEILTPNSIAASIQALDSYNAFFRYTEPYYYYVPATQISCLLICSLAIASFVPSSVKVPLRRAAVFGVIALLLTAFIVLHYNLKMFFGPVDRLGQSVHRLHFEWAVWNGVRIICVLIEVCFCICGYREIVRLSSSRA